MKEIILLVEPVWGLSRDEVKPIIAAVESGDRNKIEAAIRTLEEMLATTPKDQFPEYAKYRAFEAEVKAKIAVLKAILSNEESDWEKAHAAYQELENALDALAASCTPYEDIAKIMFEADAEHACKLAALCLSKIESKKAEAARKLLAKEAKRLIDRIGPRLGYDYTYPPSFPDSRQDICAVRRMAEDGSEYGFDTIYLVWRDKNGELKHRELINSRSTKDYIHIKKVREENNKVVIEVFSGGSYSGSPWNQTIEIPIAELNLK